MIRVGIQTPLNLESDNWPRMQRASIDRILGCLTISAFGIGDDGVPWIEIPDNEAEMLTGLSCVALEIPEEEPGANVYMHIAFSGGDGLEPIGVINDGASAIHVDAVFRVSADPASQQLPITGQWRINIRDSQGAIYDIILVSFVDGAASFDYTTTGRAEICSILQSDMTSRFDIGEQNYGVVLIGDLEFKVYRDMTGE